MKSLFFSVPVVLLIGACHSPEEDTAVEYPTEVISEAGDFRVSWTSSPDPIVPVEFFSMVFEIEESATNLPVDETAVLTLEVTMPDHGHGMTVEPVLVGMGEGRWEASPMKFHMTGFWEMVLSIEHAVGDDQAVFGVDCCQAPQ